MSILSGKVDTKFATKFGTKIAMIKVRHDGVLEQVCSNGSSRILDILLK